MAYWIEFEDHAPICHGTAESMADARAAVSHLGTVKRVGAIGFPAEPRFDEDKEGWDYNAGQIPSFCSWPNRCVRWGEESAVCASPHGRSCTA